MKTFSLRIQDAEHQYTCAEVTQFIGADSSGQFGVLAGAERVLAALQFGLARFKPATDAWHYVALPSAILQFDGNEMLITTSHFLLDTRREAMSQALTEEITQSEQHIQSAKKTINELEHALLKKLWDMNRSQP